MKQRIYHQGHFDGACFLYSITNAYSALMQREIKPEMWEEALKWIPFREDYLSDTGTQRSDDDTNLYKFTINRLLREYPKGKVISLKEYPEVSGINQLQKLINKNSVVILNVSGEHWVSVVDYDEHHLQIACSYQLTGSKKPYNESISTNFNRKYNLVKKYGKLKWIYNPSVFCLSIESI